MIRSRVHVLLRSAHYRLTKGSGDYRPAPQAGGLTKLLGCQTIRLIAQRKLAEALAQAVIMLRAAALTEE